MRLVKNLLVGVLLLIISSSCVPKYTCMEAPLQCASCRTIEISYKPVPADLLTREFPTECILILDPFDVTKVTESENPVTDMQKMTSLYRQYSEYLLTLNTQKKTCELKLQKQRDDILKDSKEYCKKFSMMYDTSRSVCIPDPNAK